MSHIKSTSHHQCISNFKNVKGLYQSRYLICPNRLRMIFKNPLMLDFLNKISLFWWFILKNNFPCWGINTNVYITSQIFQYSYSPHYIDDETDYFIWKCSKLTQCLRGKLYKRKVSSEKESLLCSTKHKLSKRDLAIVFKEYSHTCEQSNF